MNAITWDDLDDDATAAPDEEDVTHVTGDDDDDLTNVWDDEDEVTNVAAVPLVRAAMAKVAAASRAAAAPSTPPRPSVRVAPLPLPGVPVPTPLPPPSRLPTPLPPPSRLAAPSRMPKPSRLPAPASFGALPPLSRVPTPPPPTLSRPPTPPPPRPRSLPPPPRSPSVAPRADNAIDMDSAPSQPQYVPPSLPPRGRMRLDSMDQLPSVHAAIPFELAERLPGIRPPANQSMALHALSAIRNAPTLVPLAPRVPHLAPVGPSSVSPMAWSEPPFAYEGRPRRRRGGLVLVAGALLGIAAAAAFFIVPHETLSSLPERARALPERAQSLLGFGAGTLVVSAEGPNQARVGGVRVFVDGTQRCNEVPCKLDDLPRGSHLVRVLADGFAATGERAVIVGSESSFHFALAAPQTEASAKLGVPDAKRDGAVAKTEPAPSAPSAAKAEEPVAIFDADEGGAASQGEASSPKASSADSPPAAKGGALPTRRRVAAPAAKTRAANALAAAPPAADAKAILHLSATPNAAVVVDGRPLGTTPKTVRVSPGAHTVVFAAGSQRKAQSVTVQAGATKSVGAKF